MFTGAFTNDEKVCAVLWVVGFITGLGVGLMLGEWVFR